ncbi:MAG: lytic transglycosylase domain-containing protein [Myxococcota bacterium]
MVWFWILWASIAAALEPTSTSAEGLAAQLLQVERHIRDAAQPLDAALMEAGHQQQVIYRYLVTHPELREPVFAALPEDVRDIAKTNVFATSQIMRTVGKSRVAVPPWTIVAPAEILDLQSHYMAAEEEFGVPWEILAGIHLVETRMGRLRGVSTAGAKGPMQFIPETWARFGEGDIENNRDAIFAAARHLKHHGAPDRIDKALWHYNPTDRYVNAVRGYASMIEQNPLAYRGYYAWQVYYKTIRGYLHLPEGYAETEKIPVDTWCAANDCP